MGRYVQHKANEAERKGMYMGEWRAGNVTGTQRLLQGRRELEGSDMS